jgi:hypothetical protein
MLSLIERPLSWRGSAIAGSLLLAAGAAYCLAYTLSQGLVESPLVPLAWGIANLLPWLAAFELAKRGAGERGRAFPPSGALAAIIAGTVLLSLLLEIGLGIIAAPASSSELAFQALRRLPGAALVLFLLLLAGVLREGGQARAAAEASLPLLAQQIDWIKAAGNYLEFHCPAGLVMRRMTIKQAEAALADQGFIRIHRSRLVNASRIARLHRGKLADEVELVDGTIHRVGGAYRSQLRRLEPRRAN